MKRIDTLDYLRGFALVGIIFINIYQMVPCVPVPPEYGFWSRLDQGLLTFVNDAVYGRFYTIFSFLFGLGFYLFVSRARAKGEKANVLFVRRLLVLLAFGLVHHQFQPGEALLIYALLGFLLLPLYRLKPGVNLSIGVLLLLSACWLGPIGISLGMFLFGLWAGQNKIFEDVRQHKKRWIVAMILSLVLIPLGLWAESRLVDATGLVDIAMVAGGLPEDVLYVTTLTLLLELPFMKLWLMPLNRLGRMALTNYIMQTVLILTMDAVLNLSGQAYYLILAMIAIEILVIQAIFCTLWLSRFPMGPLEWVWRIGTYGKIPPHYSKQA